MALRRRRKGTRLNRIAEWWLDETVSRLDFGILCVSMVGVWILHGWLLLLWAIAMGGTNFAVQHWLEKHNLDDQRGH